MEKFNLIIILTILSCCKANENYNYGRRRNIYKNRNYAAPSLNYNYMDGVSSINPTDTNYNQGQMPSTQSSYSNYKSYEYDSGKTSHNSYKNKVKKSQTNGAWIPGAGFIPGYPFTYLKDSYNGHSPTAKTYNNDYISQNSYNGDSKYDTTYNDSYTYPSSTTSNDPGYYSSSNDPYSYSSTYNDPYFYSSSNDPYYNSNSNDPYLYSSSNDPYFYSPARFSNNPDYYMNDPYYYSSSSISRYPNFYSIPVNANNVYAYSVPVSPNNGYSAPFSLYNQYSYSRPTIPNSYTSNSYGSYSYTNPSNMNKAYTSSRPYTPFDKYIYSNRYPKSLSSSYSNPSSNIYISSYGLQHNPNIYSDLSTTNYASSYSDPYFNQYPINSNSLNPFVPYDPYFNSISTNVYYDDQYSQFSPVTEFQYNMIQDYKKYPSTVSAKFVRATPYLNYGYTSRSLPRYSDDYGSYNNNKKSSAMNYRRGYYKK